MSQQIWVLEDADTKERKEKIDMKKMNKEKQKANI